MQVESDKERKFKEIQRKKDELEHTLEELGTVQSKDPRLQIQIQNFKF